MRSKVMVINYNNYVFCLVQYFLNLHFCFLIQRTHIQITITMNVLQYKTIDIKYNFIIRRKNKSDYKTLNYINSGRRIQSDIFFFYL